MSLDILCLVFVTLVYKHVWNCQFFANVPRDDEWGTQEDKGGAR